MRQDRVGKADGLERRACIRRRNAPRAADDRSASRAPAPVSRTPRRPSRLASVPPSRPAADDHDIKILPGQFILHGAISSPKPRRSINAAAPSVRPADGRSLGLDRDGRGRLLKLRCKCAIASSIPMPSGSR